jgi:hypothetical protein
MVSSTLPKNERWDNFRYIKLSQRSFFGKIEDTINCFQDLLTFRKIVGKVRKIAGKVLFCWKGFRNAGKILEMQERFCKLLGNILEFWVWFYLRKKVGKVLEIQERF